MLWYKGWLETRFRLLFAFGMLSYSVAMTRWGAMKSMEPGMMLETLMIFWLIAPIFLAGAGIKTQASFRTSKGVHGSMLYTLSLPVSRLRLLLIRTGVGWIEMAALFLIGMLAIWILSPVLKVHATYSDVWKHALVMIVCCTLFYSITVLLATFLDDLWQVWGSMIIVLVLFWLSHAIPMPQSVNVFYAIAGGSPLVTHAIPWTSLGVSLCAAAILIWAAVKVAEARQY